MNNLFKLTIYLLDSNNVDSWDGSNNTTLFNIKFDLKLTARLVVLELAIPIYITQINLKKNLHTK